MTAGEDPSRSHLIPVEHPERLMARLRGWDPVVDPYGTGLLRSFQQDMFSFFEPFTPPFTDTGYIRPQMLDNALFGYNQIDNASRTDQEHIAQDNAPPQANAVSLVLESGITESRSDRQPVAEDNLGSADLDDRRDSRTIKKGVEIQDGIGEIESKKGKDSIGSGTSIDSPKAEDADVNPSVNTIRDLENNEPSTIIMNGTERDEDQNRISEANVQDTVDMFRGRIEEDRTDSGIFQEESEVNLGHDTTDVNASQDALVEEANDIHTRHENAYMSGLDIGDQDQTNSVGDILGVAGMFPVPQDLHSLQSNTYEVLNTDMEFRVNMDVMHFKPEEIEIRVENNRIIVHGRHAERQDDHGLIEREFTRIYTVPEDADPDNVTSCLYANGVLTVRAPKRKQPVTEK